MKRKEISTTENPARTEVDAAASGHSVANTEDLPNGFQMTELGPLPKEWRVVRLGEVLERSFSGVWGEEPTVATKDDQYTIVRVIRVSDVEPNSQIAYDKVPFRAVRRRDAERCRLKPTDILVVKSSGSKTKVISGRSAIFEKDSDNVYIPANFLLALRPSKVLSEAYFVWYYLLTPKAKQWVEHIVEGSTYPNLNKAEYLAMPIPLPPLPEQRAIAHVLRTVQRAKEATEGVIAALKELKKSLMQHLFTYGPVPVTERKRVPLQETEIGPLPKEWRVVRLGEVAEKPQYGFTAAAQRDPVGPKMLRITDIQDGNVNWNAVPYCECGNDDIPKYLLEAGDILFARTGSVGKAFLVSSVLEPSIFASYLIRVRVDRTRLDPQFAFLFMQSAAYWSQIASQTHGAVQPNINATQLRSLLLPLPPLDEQREIARMLQAVDAKIAAEQTRCAALEDLFKTLLHELRSCQDVCVSVCVRGAYRS